MTRKKPKGTAQGPTENEAVEVSSGINGQRPCITTSTPSVPPTLVICRNKHWRYISSYHGPWLNLPPEVLESLAFSNYYSPRPRPVDPAVFFDLVKIRKLIDDATSLAVRAANGTTSASLHSSLNGNNGMLYGADAEILGLGSSRGGGNAKLSRERKHRMREHATQKLSHAYRLDEIASSVAVMQSASALEDVAKHVLQRNEQDPDAEYVHFFHEKIPSMCMAQHTDLNTLSDVIRQRPTEAATYRTRAVARVFKDDLEGAAVDCTDGLKTFRLYHPQQPDQQRDLILAKDAAKMDRDYRSDGRVEEKDQPSSLEPQLLFQRGNAYLTLACDNIGRALQSNLKGGRCHDGAAHNGDSTPEAPTDLEKEQARDGADARKVVRTFAKRALRDYVSFLSHFDYTPGLSTEYTEAFLEKVSSTNFGNGRRSRSERLLDLDAHSGSGLSEALVKYQGQKDRQDNRPLPQTPKPAIYTLNTLFAAMPPADLPPYPSQPGTRIDTNGFSLPDFSEAVTYHPLLTDVLHSLLLCHCLIQTSMKEHSRHAYMAARIARVCDGYPVFLAARSPARADWVEVLRRSKNWLGLSASWEDLCSPAPLPGQNGNHMPKPLKKDVTNGKLIEQASADGETTIQEEMRASLKAREMKAARREEEEARKEYCRAKMPENGMNGNNLDTNASARKSKRWAQEDGREYPVTTERADAIVRWIMEAPPPSSSDGGSRPKKRSAAKGKLRTMASTTSSLRDTGLEQGVDKLDLVD
ncbi:hypothetical protein LTR10_011562 [Elasticomyces elasticus]|uniref:Uncharacterized protein n=1 Tax=Exophiala sideris TaxID=1016849 RepID=A0ABR0JCU8_9EURO|nr:hypothetical protein LTR10_011562 [Elasticomyces elasticus]KAK5031981.1 hypothetical protein LTS07_004602 [Exophiala sideris]KAK5040910.1 hypothetical protein LTR13_003211 [Exophiala sideris]KAK5061756.1 hypothetical protein LTR69_004939 [Exophiala sideris]KAK5184456.1 hypothetical protein LTR44_003130 [Eurotiomycetes sp. CCFEE 6388]